MIYQTIFALTLALANAADFQVERDLQAKGINMCANYDIVTTRMADGKDNCQCDGRKLVCKFNKLCNVDDTCASLSMDIDFTEPGKEQLTYEAIYNQDLLTSTLVLDVSTNPEKDGILGCSMIYGQAACTCTSCSTGEKAGEGVKIECPGAATSGCQSIDVVNFEAYVPFFGVDSQTTIARAVSSEQGSSSGVSPSTKTASAAAVALLALAAL